MLETIIARGLKIGAEKLPGSASWIDRIRINALAFEQRDEREYVIKTRRASSAIILPIANVFFRLAGASARVLVPVRQWQKREVDCFRLLNGDRFGAAVEGERSIGMERIPGVTLATHFEEGTFEEEMLTAAGKELRRAHDFECAEFDGLWSHGDANLANFVIDPVTNCARLIDFELIHHRGMPAMERHAEDLLVFMQDLAGCVPAPRWIPCALRFLEAYDGPVATGLLAGKLVLPRGIPWLWWKIRCNYLSTAEMKGRINALREALA